MYILTQDILTILLKDRTTNKNIRWCTTDYKFKFQDEIQLDSIDLIKPRYEKTKEAQKNRSKVKAEVMTPKWVCEEMTNKVDEAWFEDHPNWTWQDYIKDKRLEITCGEAPFLVSRYDVVTGEIFPINQRIGLIDKKLKMVNEHSNTKEEWFDLTSIALKNSYGYEWQGDNLFLARKNIILTVVDFYIDKFNDENIPLDYMKTFVEIISWNLWQMDGLKCVIPLSCHKENTTNSLLSIIGKNDVIEGKDCEGCLKDDVHKHNGIYSKIKDWDTDEVFEFRTMLKQQPVNNVNQQEQTLSIESLF